MAFVKLMGRLENARCLLEVPTTLIAKGHYCHVGTEVKPIVGANNTC